MANSSCLFLYQVAEKPSRSASRRLRACPEFIEGTNGGELIALVIFRSAEPAEA
jgi:hypothetical protein